MEESEQAWLKEMGESKSQDEILTSLSDLMYLGNLEKATQEFKLLLTLLPVEMVKRSLKGAQGRLSIQANCLKQIFCFLFSLGKIGFRPNVWLNTFTNLFGMHF